MPHKTSIILLVAIGLFAIGDNTFAIEVTATSRQLPAVSHFGESPVLSSENRVGLFRPLMRVEFNKHIPDLSFLRVSDEEVTSPTEPRSFLVRWGLPVGLTIGAGALIYTLYSVRSR